jgi:hypothetical protein
MSNSFITREGFISIGNSIVCGSLFTTDNIIGNITTSSYVMSSSFSQTSLTASVVLNAVTSSISNFSDSSSISITSSILKNPSYAPTVGIGYIFPNIIITTGSLAISRSLGLDRILFTPFTVEKTCAVSTMGIMFGSTGVEATVRLGIYSDSGQTCPQFLIQDLGFMSSSTIPLAYSGITPSTSIILEKRKLYWTAVVGNNNLTLNICGLSNGLYNQFLGVTPVAGTITQTGFYNISGLTSASNGSNLSLPLTCSQNISTYTLQTGSIDNLYLGPLVQISY